MSEPAGHAADGWRRTSPLGFVVRAIVGLRNAVLPAAAAVIGTGAWERGAAAVLPVLAAVMLLSLFFSYLAWRQFRYRLGESDIRVEHGLLSRTARSVPYERIQDVSLEQALVPRLFGLVEVRFETGAGGKDELKIGYIEEAEGEALRETVRARRSGEAELSGEAEAASETEGRLLFAMDTPRLLTFGVFEFSLVVFAVLGGAAQQFDFLLPFDIWNFEAWMRLLAGPGHWLRELGVAAQAIGALLALAVLGLIGLATGIARTFLRDYGFLLEETPKGLRRRRGLLTRTDVVMPLHRVQALKVTTGFVRRRFGWHGLSVVSLAQDAKSESHVVVPFGTLGEIAPVVRVTGFELPDEAVEWRRPSRRYRLDRILTSVLPLGLAAIGAAVIGSFLPEGFAELAFGLSLPVAGFALFGLVIAVREALLWRRERHALDARHIYVRRGVFAPRLDIASRVKLQSVEIVQGPIARRRGYADVKFGIAGGKLDVEGVPLDEARAIRDAVLGSIAAVDFSRLPG